MSTFKKTIFLTNNEKDSGIGILKLEKKNNNIFGSLKTYQKNLDGQYILGIKVNDKIIKQNINLSNNTYSFILSEKVDLSNNIGIVLIKSSNTEFTPIIWGSEKAETYKSHIINTLQESIKKISNSITDNQKNEISSIKQTNPTDILKETIVSENYSDNLINNSSSTHNNFSKYTTQEFFENLNIPTNNYDWGMAYSPTRNIDFENNISSLSQISLNEEIITNQSPQEIAVASTHADLFESSDEEVESIIDKELKPFISDNQKFYNMIADQLNELFDKYPEEKNLTKLIDNSMWVKIDAEYDNKFYVVGIIKDNKDIKYICYGVPGKYSKEPPNEMKEYSQWLPVDVKDPYSNGYWVMYQDANTGENIFIN